MTGLGARVRYSLNAIATVCTGTPLGILTEMTIRVRTRVRVLIESAVGATGCVQVEESEIHKDRVSTSAAYRDLARRQVR